MLEMDDFTPRKTPQKGAFQGLAKPHFNHFHLQTAPPLAKPYFRQMLLNGIGLRPGVTEPLALQYANAMLGRY